MIKQFLKIGQHIMANRLNRDILPAFITFIPTWRCNSRCLMCEVWRKNLQQNEMSISEIRTIFSQLGVLIGVRITGGEPFLRDDLAQIINLIIQENNPQIIHITSNGYLTDQILKTIDSISEPSRIHLKISIDAFGAEHDKIRGIPGAFAKAEKTLLELAKISKEKKIYIGINQTIVEEKALKDGQLQKWCANMGLVLLRTVAHKNIALFSSSPSKVILPEKINEFYLDIASDFFIDFIEKELYFLQRVEKLSEKLTKRYYFKVLKCFAENKACFPPCVHLNSHFHILPNGDIPVCYFNSNIIGNLVKSKLSQIKKSNEFADAREWIKSCSGCMAGCELMPNGIFSGEILRKII
ncbi:MAG: radical SAM protein [Candidatus Omnitrophota bacterium]